jgi:hypothetical protein
VCFFGSVNTLQQSCYVYYKVQQSCYVYYKVQQSCYMYYKVQQSCYVYYKVQQSCYVYYKVQQSCYMYYKGRTKSKHLLTKRSVFFVSETIYRLARVWTVRGSCPGRDNRVFVQNLPDRLSSLLNEYWVSFPGSEVDHSPLVPG